MALAGSRDTGTNGAWIIVITCVGFVTAECASIEVDACIKCAGQVVVAGVRVRAACGLITCADGAGGAEGALYRCVDAFAGRSVAAIFSADQKVIARLGFRLTSNGWQALVDGANISVVARD